MCAEQVSIEPYRIDKGRTWLGSRFVTIQPSHFGPTNKVLMMPLFSIGQSSCTHPIYHTHPCRIWMKVQYQLLFQQRIGKGCDWVWCQHEQRIWINS